MSLYAMFPATQLRSNTGITGVHTTAPATSLAMRDLLIRRRVHAVRWRGDLFGYLGVREIQLLRKEAKHACLQTLSDFITVVPALVNLEHVRDAPLRQSP